MSDPRLAAARQRDGQPPATLPGEQYCGKLMHTPRDSCSALTGLKTIRSTKHSV